MLRDPYILEFTGLADLPAYSEDDLESALLDHLQRFLLELGTGFCFEARQFRMTEGRRHHRVDLVLYHRRLRCHVLIDLKIRAFQPADADQMNFYVNWFKANMQAEGDLPPVGILLCSDRDGTEVEFATAGMDNTLFVSRASPASLCRPFRAGLLSACPPRALPWAVIFRPVGASASDTVPAGRSGFTEEELDFILNYDIKYRLGRKPEEDEG